MIVEYKLHRLKDGRTCVPTFIVNGGYFPVDKKWIGIAADDGTYIPETLVVLDRAALITRMTNFPLKWHPTSPDDDPRGRLATTEEIIWEADNFISKHDFGRTT